MDIYLGKNPILLLLQTDLVLYFPLIVGIYSDTVWHSNDSGELGFLSGKSSLFVGLIY